MNMETLSFGAALDVLPDAVIAVDEHGRIAHANRVVQTLLGYRPQALLDQPLELLLPARYRARHRRLVPEYQKGGEPKLMSNRSVLYAIHRDGHEVPVTIALSNLPVGSRMYSLAVLRDAAVAELQLRDAIERSEKDALTGLGNREHLMRRLNAACEKPQQPFALMYLDLKSFKPFNDRYGHHAGDLVLQLVARRLREVTRPTDVITRPGGDEFVMLLPGLQCETVLTERADAIAEAIAAPLEIPGVDGAVGANIGCSVFPHDAATAEALLQLADRSMYAAKTSGRHFAFFAHLAAGEEGATA